MMLPKTKTDNTIKSLKAGFTIIELMFAMAGIAFLLLFVLYAIMHATNLYSKGLSIRQINQVGRQMSDELSRAVRHGDRPRIAGTHRLCVDNKSYIWNTPDDQTNENNVGVPIGFVRVDGTQYCDDITTKVPANTEELLGNIATVLEMEITEPVAGSRVYELHLVVGTSGDRVRPVKNPVTAQYECSTDTNDAQYCAFGQFDTVIYARRSQ
ncbi:MAG: hypothetical protein ABIQ64_00350 [Candidatus Saccharimonadales bacterium]